MTDKPLELNTSQTSSETPPPLITLTVHQAGVIRNLLFASSSTLLGTPYVFGAKADDVTQIPKALDCSGLVSWVCRKSGLKIPEGSQNQFNFTIATDKPQTGDFGFFAHGKDITKVYHVGMIYDGDRMIEARAYDPTASFKTGCVILRPISRWTEWHEFVGFRSHPKLVIA